MKTRRKFLITAAGAVAAPRIFAQNNPPSRRLRVAVMGLSRGMAHVSSWLQVPNVEIAALCEVDRRRIDEGLRTVEKAGKKSTPLTGSDFRKFLEGDKIDVLSVAACNFWHTTAALLAVQAGKHVYVEKPGSHTAYESTLLAAASKKHGRLIQQGTQRRSLPAMREAIQRLKEGAIGNVRAARCYYDSERPTIGRGKPAPVPEWLDWEMWQGPCAERPYKDNILHYNWHWFWHYGGGELANNGVHGSISPSGASTKPTAKSSRRAVSPATAGAIISRTTRKTPDTTLLAADFGPCAVVWDGSSCHKRTGGEKHAFVTFYGDNGTMALSSEGYTLYDKGGKEIHKNTPPFSDLPHFQTLPTRSARESRLIAPPQKASAARCFAIWGISPTAPAASSSSTVKSSS
jgi:predicted dehydrogenase